MAQNDRKSSMNGSMDISPDSVLLSPMSEKRKRRTVVVACELIRIVRRGIKLTKKYIEGREGKLDSIVINETDTRGQTIFHLSIQRTELLEYLLDTFRNHDQLNTCLHMEDINGYTPAHVAVLLNERKSFHALGSFYGNIYQIQSSLLKKSLTHCAIESNNCNLLEEIVEQRPDAIYDQDINEKLPLHYAAVLKDSTILEYLVCQGVDILEVDQKGFTALHFAAQSGFLVNVELLLAYDIELIQMFNGYDQTALHIACNNGYDDIVDVLLENGSDPFLRDDKGDTCLECAIKNKHLMATERLIMTDEWKELIAEVKGGAKNCFVNLLKNMPEAAKTLLNRCYTKHADCTNTDEHNITYDFFLLESSGTPEYEGLATILYNDRDDCLTHPVTRKFLSLKWRNKGYKVYIVNVSMYLVFHILFNTYINLLRGSITEPPGEPALDAPSGSPNNDDQSWKYPTPHVKPNDTNAIIAASIIAPLTIINLLKELLQMYFSGWKYFQEVTNYFEWVLYVCVLVFMFPAHSEKSVGQYFAGSIAVFFTWFNFIWFLKRMPALGTYILALLKVFTTLLRMLAIIGLFCVAFASTFHLLLAEYDRFHYFHIAVISTFVSMLGDFNYDDLFVSIGYHKTFYNFKMGIFVIFLLLMGVVVNNVLIGLAVGDTDSVMKQATLKNLQEQVKFVIEIEKSVLGKLSCFNTKIESVYTDYPFRKNTCMEQVKNFFFGEWDSSDHEEDNDLNEVKDEKQNEMIDKRLDMFHKQMIKELKEFKDDLLDEIKAN